MGGGEAGGKLYGAGHGVDVKLNLFWIPGALLCQIHIYSGSTLARAA